MGVTFIIVVIKYVDRFDASVVAMWSRCGREMVAVKDAYQLPVEIIFLHTPVRVCVKEIKSLRYAVCL